MLSRLDFALKLKEARPDLTIIDYTKSKSPATVRCSKGHEWTVPSADKLLRIKNKAYQCPYCSGYYKDLSKEAIGVIKPELLQYFKNKDEAFKYTRYSDAKVDLKCPICGFEKKCTVGNLYSRGFSCNECRDGISMPNKMIREVIRQCKNQVTYYNFEHSPEWLGGQAFDAYFEKDGYKIAVEMQGLQHYKKLSFMSDDEFLLQLKRDTTKRKLAEDNGVIEIEIPSKVSTIYYQKEKILESNLSNYLDLTVIDWDDVFYSVNNPIISKVIDLYKKGKSSFEIHVDLNICQATVIKYLKIAHDLNLIDFKLHSNYHDIEVQFIDTNTKMNFKSLRSARQYIIDNYGYSVDISTIRNYSRDKKIYKDKFLFNILN